MFLVFFFIMVLAFCIYFMDYKEKLNRWSGTLMAVSGLGSLAIYLEYELAPNVISQYPQYPSIHDIVILIAYLCSSTYYYIIPYLFLQISLIIADFQSKKIKIVLMVLKLITLIPPVLMWVILGITPAKQVDFWMVAIWSVPYLLVSVCIQCYAYLSEHNQQVKAVILRSILILVPAAITISFTNYILTALGYTDSWQYNTFLIAYLVIIFLYLLINKGTLGTRIRIERDGSSNTFEAAILGTTVMNHAIKNEAVKISLGIENLKFYLFEETNGLTKNPSEKSEFEAHIANRRDRLEDNMLAISSASEHLMSITARLQKNIREIVLTESEMNLIEGIEKAIIFLKPQLKEKNITFQKQYFSNFCIKFDEICLIELLGNIISNAIEAMQTEGVLTIRVYRKNKQVVLEIGDNGCGIPKDELKKVLEPFYTSKTTKTNFGLGLVFCNQVIKKHGGSLEIVSTQRIGTCVYINFAKNKVMGEIPVN